MNNLKPSIKNQNIIFRADASSLIGNGHIMRCLTLADELSTLGAKISFITRSHVGHLDQLIADKGYKIFKLLPPSVNDYSQDTYQQWLGIEQRDDALETIEKIKHLSIDWLIIDHYALDKIWHKALSPYTKKTMVIDDLANRHYHCNLLLDMTTGRKNTDYDVFVAPKTNLLFGSDYALIRPQFKKLRTKSIARRQQPHPIKNILIAMGGSDPKDSTSWVLKTLARMNVTSKINVILGHNAPHMDQVKKQIRSMKSQVILHHHINDMASYMHLADLSIGTAGTTSWERCCLALPSIVIVTEDNQNTIAHTLANLNSIINLGDFNTLTSEQLEQALLKMNNYPLRSKMSIQASKLCDGQGVQRVIQAMSHVY